MKYRLSHYGHGSLLKLALCISALTVANLTACRREWLSGAKEKKVVTPVSGEEAVPKVESTQTSTPVVGVVSGQNPGEMVRQAVALAGGLQEVINPGVTVLIKPNLTIPSASGLGNVTDSRVVQAVIELCQEAGAGQILVGDGSGGGDSVEIMRQAGYEPVLKATGASFVDLNHAEVVIRRLEEADGLPEYSFAKTAIEASVLISVAVLKTHNEAGVTLSCKNLIGITSRSVHGYSRWQLHNVGVQRAIADIVRLRTPNFAVIDGIVGLEGNSPLSGTPVPMNLILAGQNPVSVDAVGAAIMGFNPKELEQLVLLAKRGVGEIDLAEIAVRGVSVADVQRPFRRK